MFLAVYKKLKIITNVNIPRNTSISTSIIAENINENLIIEEEKMK
jgi:hypothetical protein